MARAQSEYLRIYDSTGLTYNRWQSYYANATVTYSGATWDYVPFVADGFTAGVGAEESNISVRAPAISLVVSTFETAIEQGRLVDLSIYEFDTNDGNTTPQAGQVLVGTYTGQVVGGSAGLTTITLQLGSALSPIGSQIPPRKFTTAIMGPGCRL